MLWIISGQKNFTGRPFHLVKPKPPLKHINKKLLVLFYTCNMQVRFDLVVLNDSKGVVVEWTSKHVIKSFWKVYALSASNIKRLAAVSHCFSNLSHTVRKQGAVNPSLHFKQVLLAVCNLTRIYLLTCDSQQHLCLWHVCLFCVGCYSFTFTGLRCCTKSHVATADRELRTPFKK